MASVMTEKELSAMKERLESTRKRIKGNKEEAIKVLKNAGIADKNGIIKPQFRNQ